MIRTKIDFENIDKQIDENLEALKNADWSNFSGEEKMQFLKKLEELEEVAMEAKAQFKTK